MLEQAERRCPPRPLLGAGVILFSANLTEVLLVQRANPPAAGSWSFPGGLVRAGESVRQACGRELAEETGLRLPLAGLALVAERILRAPADATVEVHYLILDFWGIAPAQATPLAGSDAAQARFVPLGAIEQLPLTPGLPQAVRYALALARGEQQGPLMLEEPDC